MPFFARFAGIFAIIIAVSSAETTTEEPVTEALATIKITIEGEYSNLADGEDETIKQMAQAKFQAEGDREAFVIESITVAPGSIIVTIVFAAGSDTDTITSIGVDIANNGIDGYKVLAVDSNTQAQDKSFVSLGYTVVTNPVRGHGKNGVTFINGVRQDDASSTSSGNSNPKKNKKAKKQKSSSAGTDSLMKGQTMEASGAIAAGAAGLILVVGGALVAVNRIRKTAGYNQAEQPSIPADERTALVARPVVA